MYSLELYVHHINFSICGQCFVTHNQILYCSCNIGTASHLLFTKLLSSELQECFGKVLYHLGFLQFHLIVILIWNKLFGWLHTIWIWNSKTLLLSLNEFIFLHISPINLLLCLCLIFCIYFSFSFKFNDLLPPLHVASCWDIVSFPRFVTLH